MAGKSQCISIWLWGLAMLLFCGSALALGMGDIQVNSRLNQPFSAVIPLTTDSSSDLNGLKVSLGDAAAFHRAGVVQTDILSSLHFSIDTHGANSVIVVKSDRVVREPYLIFLVQVQWNGGTLLREYTVLMNPPDLGVQTAPAATENKANSAASAAAGATEVEPPPPIAVPPSHQAKAAQPGSPSAVSRGAASYVRKEDATDNKRPDNHAATASAAADISGQGRYGPVKAGETFWSIAKNARPDGVTIDQVMLSIYRANRGDFDRGRFDGLMKGSVLSIPSAASMRATSAADARSIVTDLRHGRSLAPSAPNQQQPGKTPPAKPAQAEPPPQTVTKPSAGIAAEIPGSRSTPPPSSAPTSSSSPQETSASPGMSSNAAMGGETAAVEQASPQPVQANAAPAAAVPMSAASVASRYAPAASVSTPAAVTTEAQSQPPAQSVATRPQLPGQKNFIGRWRGLLLALLVLALVALLFALRQRRRGERSPQSGDVEPLPRPLFPAPQKVPPAKSYPTKIEPQDVTVVRPGGISVATSSQPADILSSIESESRSPGLAGRGEGFDAAAVGDAGKLEMNPGDSVDPISEVDFHLAYGLYDEAIQLLQRELAKSPQRKDIKLKLADCYAIAGKPVEYQDLAGELQNEVSMQDWVHIAEQGRKLCPGVALFERPPPPAPVILPADLAPLVDEPASEPPQTPGDNIIDFDPEPPPVPEPTTAAAPQQDVTAPRTLDLGDFDSFGVRPTSLDDNRVDFNLGALDLSETDEASVEPDSGEQTAKGQVADKESDLGDDEFTTKLDLARAYFDMGDIEAARSLLEEVVQGGSPAQKRWAETLARQLVD